MNTPAFPHQPALNANGEHIMYGATGMTVRQYYKAAVLQGICAQPDHRTFKGDTKDTEAIRKWRESLFKQDVEFAASYADHAIAEDEEHANK